MDPFIGEIQAFAFPFASGGFQNNAWMPCSGQTLPIQQYPALYSLLGTSFGGNGTTNFNLPNLNGNVAIGQGQGPGLSNRFIGETVGSSTVTLVQQQMASHSHGLQLGVHTATGAAAGPGTASNTAAINPDFNGFVAPPANTPLASNAMTLTGGGLAHDNTQPTQAIVYCIAVVGIFPSFNS